MVARGLAGADRRAAGIDGAGGLPRGSAAARARAAGADGLAVPPAVAGFGALGGQGRLPLPQQRPHRPRGPRPRLSERAVARPAGQRRRDRLDQRLPGARRGGDDAGGERHLPRRDHPAPGDRAAARRRGRGGRDGAGGRGFRGGGGDLPDRQRQQGDAGHPLRGRASSDPGGWRRGPGRSTGTMRTRAGGRRDRGAGRQGGRRKRRVGRARVSTLRPRRRGDVGVGFGGDREDICWGGA